MLTLQSFSGEDEAVALANETEYGLAATVFTRTRRARSGSRPRLVAGTVWVNCFYVRDLRLPFGGARQSGIGREGGRTRSTSSATSRPWSTATGASRMPERGTPLRVRRLHHVALRTRRTDEATHRWADLYGLTPVVDAAGRAILRCSDEDYGLELVESDRPGHDHTAYELEAGLTLADAEAWLAAHDVPTYRAAGPCGRAEGLHLMDPAGYGVELIEHAPARDRRP